MSSVVEQEYWTKEIQTAINGVWIKELKKDKNDQHRYTVISITIKAIHKSVEVQNELKLSNGIMEKSVTKEDCFGKDWGTRYPDKDIVVAFQDSNCFYNFVDQAKLEYDTWATIFVHPSGKN